MTLSKKQILELRGRGHHLKAIVTVGSAGLSEAVVREVDLSLEHHELMKIKVASQERDDRNTLIETLCQTIGAELIQRIGNVALLYRKRRLSTPE